MPDNDASGRAESGPPPALTALRSDIDRIDDALLDLMERRFALSREIAAQKDDKSGLRLRPRRETEILERLSSRSENLPSDAINAIWRELMGLSLQAQKRTAIVLHAMAQPVLVTNLVRLRFGCAAPIIISGSPADTLDRARRTDAVAIVELNPLSNWWVELHDDPALTIFDGLREPGGRISALAIGRLAADGLPRGIDYPILSEGTLRRRVEAGEAIRTLAISGALRLCLSETAQPAGGSK